ncbi:carbon-phosphorus lyase complex subunit PhnI [Plectonema cf. radiosum LEGE 06105]|uniref:Carbon-phosphorus lyase complex subunit PhnI n=1 Tax=Plectonema cf. radiosum LEGE 06105 TaxID=945769 RepID=A0A8J7K438_9CYAN|nr:carbon-phosphorus lyase complex subunit PhnI [Plectonema radiosum]MBE9214587.1 carbon-phosphorus lyase complex subunit PhnI [Plectonema cf. radiosum LEGE 06105]
MPYVAVKGGEKAIENAEALLKFLRRGDTDVQELSLEQIQQQLALAVNRVMTEGSLYDEELAALAIKQSWGDLVEAIFLLRAYRTTLARLYYSEPIDTEKMRVRRRISAIFKDVPGGQCLGPTFDYVHRLLDFKLMAEGEVPTAPLGEINSESISRVVDTLNQEGLIEDGEIKGQRDKGMGENKSIPNYQLPITNSPISNFPTPYDITREPLTFPASRDARLQNLARADEGFLLSLAYSTQRGYGRNHPFAGEIRMGEVEVVICPPELGFDVVIGEITVTEVQMVNQFKGSKDIPAQFTCGYGLTFGYNERKAMSMALIDRAMRASELDETVESPAQDIEFVMSHSDNVEAQGFVQHLKLPHYIDFQAELNLVRKMRQDASNNKQDKDIIDKFSEKDSVCQESQVTKNMDISENI